MRIERIALVALCVFGIAACASKSGVQSPAQVYDAAQLPSGPVGEQIAYGHDLFENTARLLPKNVRARMNCSACHVAAGTAPKVGSLVGAYAQFPQYNKRSKRVITLQDRIAECFLYSMNGTPPAYSSKEMIAMVSYIAWVSRGTPVLATPDPAFRYDLPLPAATPDFAHGDMVYTQRCASCHQANGEGIALAIPPLWGADSFNSGAGMHRLGTMAGFVRYNMPQNAPGSLSESDAFAVSDYILAHDRPALNAKRVIVFKPEPATYF